MLKKKVSLVLPLALLHICAIRTKKYPKEAILKIMYFQTSAQKTIKSILKCSYLRKVLNDFHI